MIFAIIIFTYLTIKAKSNLKNLNTVTGHEFRSDKEEKEEEKYHHRGQWAKDLTSSVSIPPSSLSSSSPPILLWSPLPKAMIKIIPEILHDYYIWKRIKISETNQKTQRHHRSIRCSHYQNLRTANRRTVGILKDFVLWAFDACLHLSFQYYLGLRAKDLQKPRRRALVVGFAYARLWTNCWLEAVWDSSPWLFGVFHPP